MRIKARNKRTNIQCCVNTFHVKHLKNMSTSSASHPKTSLFFPRSEMAVNNFRGPCVWTSKKHEQKIDDQLESSMGTLKSVHDCPMYKNQLQEYVQRSGLPLPVYNSVNEGFPHAPKFRSSVIIDKTKFTSQSTYADRKAAEQDVAKVAYDAVVKDNKIPSGCPHIYQNPRFCKLILHEYASKTGLGIPKYDTTLAQGPRPVFISSCVLGGKTYAGEVSRSKKTAEQLAARVAIQSLLGSDSGKLTQIIKSKDRLFASVDVKKNSGDQGAIALSVQQPGNLSRQEASIQTGIISYNPGHYTVTSCPKSWTKRKVDANNWHQNKKRVHGGVASKRP